MLCYRFLKSKQRENLFARIPHNLTAGVVSNDNLFVNKVLASTVNGVTYTGKRARTTGAP